MKALVIGGVGFVGNYLVNHLLSDEDNSVVVTTVTDQVSLKEEVHTQHLDVLNLCEIEKTLERLQPDWIFHLAAQSSVSLSWSNPQLTVDVNAKGAINILEALRRLSYSPRVLMIGSGEEYGSVTESEIPIREETRLRPGNIYAATKAFQSMAAQIYAEAYDLDVMIVRAFNHIGPYQAPSFVVADFCRQVAEVEAGLREPVLFVGNLDARRDFTDVRDVVCAYVLLMQHGQKGEVYNVGSGCCHSYKRYSCNHTRGCFMSYRSPDGAGAIQASRCAYNCCRHT